MEGIIAKNWRALARIKITSNQRLCIKSSHSVYAISRDSLIDSALILNMSAPTLEDVARERMMAVSKLVRMIKVSEAARTTGIRASRRRSLD